MHGSRVARGLAATVGGRLGLTLKREKLAHPMLGSRVARGLAAKLGSNAISRITLTKGAVVVATGKCDELSADMVKQHL